MIRVLLIPAAGLFVLLAAAWVLDRGRRWERPSWSRDRFVALDLRRRERSSRDSIRVVAINLRCPHCLASLAAVAHRDAAKESAPALVALIVDTPSRPARDAVAELPADEIWWDRSGIWRRRWGHRIYGETIHFDAAGRFLFTTPPAVTLSAPARR